MSNNNEFNKSLADLHIQTMYILQYIAEHKQDITDTDRLILEDIINTIKYTID